MDTTTTPIASDASMDSAEPGHTVPFTYPSPIPSPVPTPSPTLSELDQLELRHIHRANHPDSDTDANIRDEPPRKSRTRKS